MFDNPLEKQIIEGFEKEYGNKPETVACAPGRLEILGNHTDYNEGVVLSVAVDKVTYFAASPAEGKSCRLHDLRDGSHRSFSIADISDNIEDGDWANYIKGIIIELEDRGMDVPGFDACILSDIPLSAGMSSSAALEISSAYGLGSLTGTELPWIEWAKIGQACENKVVGARTGLLDQFSTICGRAGQLVFSDFRSLETSNVPIPDNTALIIANSMVKHNLTNEYNERRESCEKAAEAVSRADADVQSLRDVTPEMLKKCKGNMDITSYRRAVHIVEENLRVFNGIKALQKGDIEAFGKLMYDSHESSRVNFENSCPELDSLVDLGKSLPGALGARLSGGGFGGITVHLVRQNEAKDYAQRLGTAFQSLTDIDPQVMICHAGDGARVIS
ncbi:MAG: galactokinase [Lentisphaeria bacterium]